MNNTQHSTSLRHKVWGGIICALAALFYMYDYFVQVSPSIMTAELMHDFAIGAGELGILGGCFFYSYTLMQVPVGLLLDRFGARKLLTFAVLISGVGVILFSVAHGLFVAGVGRFFMGFGSSFAFLCSIYLASRWFEHRYFALLAGMVAFSGSVGSIFGLGPLASVVSNYGWRLVMLVTGLLTLVLSLIYWLVIRDGDKAEPEYTEDAEHATVKNEWQRLRLVMTMPQVWWVAACSLLSWVPAASFGALWGVPYLMKVYGWSSYTAGNWCILFWLAVGVFSPIGGLMSDLLGRRCFPMALFFGLGFIGSLILISAPHFSPYITAIGLVLLGCASAAQSMTFGFVRDGIAPSAFGTASSVVNMGSILGGALTQPLIGFILFFTWNGLRDMTGTPVYALQDYQLAMLILPVATALGLWITTYKVQETYCQDQFTLSYNAA